MVWTKNTDIAAFAPKVLSVGNAAYGALTRMVSYAGQQRTDGWLPAEVVRMIASAAELKKLLTVKANGRATPLHQPADECSCLVDKTWPSEGGFWVHDFLDQNPSRAENDVHRAKRNELRSKELRRAARERDGNACRYCGTVAPWAVHRGPTALQLEHIDPRHPRGLAGVVWSCAGCNARKGKNTPEAAGMVLLPPPVEVPEGGWQPGDEPTIERAWPADEPTEATAGEPRDPTAVRPRDPTSDPSPVDDRGTSTSANSDPTAVSTDDAIAVADYPGAGRAGIPPDPGSGSAGVSPATTPRSATSPNPYTKTNTSNPDPLTVDIAQRLGCSLTDAERVIRKTVGRKSIDDPAAYLARIPDADLRTRLPRSRSRRPPPLPPPCGECDARPGDENPRARVVWLDADRTRSDLCPRCSPEAVSARDASP